MKDGRISWLAWGCAAGFPVLLYVAVLNTSNRDTALQVLLPAVLMALPAGLLRRQPLPALALMLTGSFAATVSLGSATVGRTQVLVLAVALGVVAAVARRRVSVAALVATLAAQVAALPYYTAGNDDFVLSLGFVVITVIAGFTVGDSIRQRRTHADTLRSQAAAQAVDAERLRIARELHDMIAHSVGVIAIQAGVGSRVMDSQPAEARKALDVIESTSRKTLAELRQVLGGLRGPAPGTRPLGPTPGTGPLGPAPGTGPLGPAPGTEPLGPAPGLADLDRVVESARNAGVRVIVRRQGDPRPPPAHLDLSAFRIVQEAVTNVVRHANARECRVTIDRRAGELTIEIVDDGSGTPTEDSRTPAGGSGPSADDSGTPAGGGYGIAGMRERAALLGGRLDAGPRPEGGFRVVARLPVPATEKHRDLR